MEPLAVEFREPGGGIFAAHPWLEGPRDTYLGFGKRGGGASGEHSHALNLWQHLAHEVGAGRVVEVSAAMDYVRTDEVDYDKLCLLNLQTESGLVGRVVQDVVTSPPRKWARVQGRDGYVELTVGIEPGVDQVESKSGAGAASVERIKKTRPDDFIEELKHVEAVLEGCSDALSIGLDRGLDTMLVIAAAHRSAQEKRSVQIDYESGCSVEALSSA